MFLLRPDESAAVLAWDYEGTDGNQKLSLLIPPALNIRLSELDGLDVVPFADSRTYDSGDDPEVVTTQLGVKWIVVGRLSTDAAGTVATVDLVSKSGSADGWPREIRAQADAPVELADRVASAVAAALGVASGAVERRDRRALEHYLEGRSYLLGWDVEESYMRAEESFRKAFAEDPNFAPAHAGLARALWKRYEAIGDPDWVEQAFDEAQQAVLLAPNLTDAHLAMGEVLLGRGQAVEAAVSFERALELAPADDAVCRRIAASYAALSREEDAEAMYQRAIDLRPAYWENYYEKGIFYTYTRTSKLEDAKALFHKVIELRPQSDVGYNGLALVHIFSGEFDAAEPLLQAAIRINPTGAAYNNLGFVYYASGRFELALQQFRLAVEELPISIHVIGLADTYRQLDALSEAAESYVRAVELLQAGLGVNPSDAVARGYLSQALAGLGQCDSAREEASRAAPLDNDVPLVNYIAAVAYSLCGDRDEVLRNMRLAILGGATLDVRTSPDLQPYLEDPSLKDLLTP